MTAVSSPRCLEQHLLAEYLEKLYTKENLCWINSFCLLQFARSNKCIVMTECFRNTNQSKPSRGGGACVCDCVAAGGLLWSSIVVTIKTDIDINRAYFLWSHTVFSSHPSQQRWMEQYLASLQWTPSIGFLAPYPLSRYWSLQYFSSYLGSNGVATLPVPIVLFLLPLEAQPRIQEEKSRRFLYLSISKPADDSNAIYSLLLRCRESHRSGALTL